MINIVRGRPQKPPSPDKVDKAEMAFKLYDKDKDGYITRAEMVKLSKNLTKEQVEKVFGSPSKNTLHCKFSCLIPILYTKEKQNKLLDSARIFNMVYKWP